MRAWTFTRRVLPIPDILKLSNVPKLSADSLQSNEVLVKVYYSRIKPLFAKTIMRKFSHFPSALWTPEMEFSVTSEAVGPAVNANERRFEVGDQVFGCAALKSYLKYGGTAREYLIFPSGLVAKKSEAVSMEEAVALRSNACTVVQFLDTLKLQEGGKVLVATASGALGSALMPALKHAVGDSGVILGVSSATNADAVKQHGANEVINYNTVTNLTTYLKRYHATNPFNAIVDVASTSDTLYTESLANLDETGTYLFAGKVNTTHRDGDIFSVAVQLARLKIKLMPPTISGGVPRRALFISARLDRQTIEGVMQWRNPVLSLLK